MFADEYHRMMAGQMREKDLQSQVEKLARSCGWLVYHTHDSRRSGPGFPDLVLVRGRRVLWRELKTMKGRASEHQLAWLGALGAAGQDAGIWRPLDWFDGTISKELA